MQFRSKFASRRLVIETLETRRMLSSTPGISAQQRLLNAATKDITAITKQQTADCKAIVQKLAEADKQFIKDVTDVDADIQKNRESGNTQGLIQDMQWLSELGRLPSEVAKDAATETKDINKDAAQADSSISKDTVKGLTGKTTVDDTEVNQSNDLANGKSKINSDLQNFINETNAKENEAQAIDNMVSGGKSLGGFLGSFDVNFNAPDGTALDANGSLTVTLFLSKDGTKLTGQITGGSVDEYDLNTDQLQGQAHISSGTISATISKTPDGNGYTVKGSAEFNVDAITGLPAHQGQFDFVANLINNDALVGKLVSNGSFVGDLNLQLH